MEEPSQRGDTSPHGKCFQGQEYAREELTFGTPVEIVEHCLNSSLVIGLQAALPFPQGCHFGSQQNDARNIDSAGFRLLHQALMFGRSLGNFLGFTSPRICKLYNILIYNDKTMYFVAIANVADGQSSGYESVNCN